MQAPKFLPIDGPFKRILPEYLHVRVRGVDRNQMEQNT